MTPEEVFALICPAALTTSGYNQYLYLAGTLTSSGFFQEQYALAVALRAAHLWVLNAKRRGQAGVETYLMEGRLAKSYGGIGVLDNELKFTSYGWQLYNLIHAQGPAMAITSNDIYQQYLTRG